MLNPVLKQAAPYLIAVLALGAAKCSYDGEQQAKGAARVLRAQADSARKVHARALDSLSKQSRAQVETLRVTRVRRDTVLETVTQYLDREVPVPVEIVRTVIAADSQVIEACTIALLTCEQEKSILRADISTLEAERDSYRLLVPSGFSRARSGLTWAVAGALAMWFVVR
jgi:multidrug efflux pump subunit AcrA (membrane-fusion protein)